ncbi:LytS/YhcK type 5TM receptor domain-containing protein [Fictibacillus enclensis]|uniref:LytS/YhcK type 5TM receptor domain-containing protein n=1 Tax=Fictibacillus enclensis TaxID=1017270 RepID=UPI0024BFDCFD|nr:LytS/YhcK type 5TM receptor domain-containing protein [Fictibacillus enclensis]WHY73291.1 LytS/YhcK type 5TM receptor domain-containing protein [Fictibacillus enclensis]
MRDFLQPLFVNIAIVFSLTYLANTLIPFMIRREFTLRMKGIYGMIASACALLCMVYPIQTLQDSVFDLRNVPIMVATLYGGLIPGVICTLFVCAARLFIGGNFAMVGVGLALIAFVIAAAYKGFFTENKKKWKAGIVIASIYTVIYMMIINNRLNFFLLIFTGCILSLFIFLFSLLFC